MNKKNYLMLGVGIVVLIAIIIVLVSMKQDGTSSSATNTKTNKVAEKTVEETMTVAEKIQNEIPVTQAEIETVPLSEEATIKYTGNGLETKVVNAKYGERVFLTFEATDEKVHIFNFSQTAIDSSKVLETVLVMFSKQEGIKSINFVSPNVGSYEFVIDGDTKGTLIISE